jgi:hypothetical protein
MVNLSQYIKQRNDKYTKIILNRELAKKKYSLIKTGDGFKRKYLMQWPGSETTQNLFIDQDQNEDSID